MAVRKGQYGRSSYGSTVSGNILKDINLMQSSGETVRPAGTTDGTASVPDEKMINRAERKAATPYTSEQIAADPNLATIKNALSTTTYEQALANYRALTNVTNMLALNKGLSTKKQSAYNKAYAALTPEQKNAETIFFGMGGSLESNRAKYGGYGMGAVNTDLYNKLGIEAPTTSYAPVSFGVSREGNRINLSNPLSTAQRSRLRRLRSLGSLSNKQSAALANLRSKKNAPTILP